MMLAFLRWLTDRLPGRIYTDSGIGFLERYYLGRIGDRIFYIHRFFNSDPDRGLHDHPWDWAWSLVLVGRYMEARRWGPRRVVNLFNRLTGDTFHRVVLFVDSDNKPQECWTLFCHGLKVPGKGWGFLRFFHMGGVIRDGLQVESFGELVYRKHVDADGDGESDAWVKTAPKGRELRGGAR